MAERTSGAEIVVVGDEVVAGRVVDTNSAVIARQLAKIGIETQKVVRVRDDEEAIKKAVAGALVCSRLIFVCGGLGPTPDDKTLPAVAELIDRGLTVHQESLERIDRFLSRRGIKTPELAKRQAFIIEGATVFENPAGMVPGMVVEHQNSTLVLLPGVPEELVGILEGGVISYLKGRFLGQRLMVALIRTAGLIESQIAPRVNRLVGHYQGVKVGYYPSVQGLDLLISGRDKKAVTACAGKLKELFGARVYADEDKNLEVVVGEILNSRRLTLSTAESCTGGLIGDLLTNVPGSSDYYLGGVVAYANATKMRVLGVKENTLKSYGAVSSQTVKEMVTGVCRVIGSDCGIAVSGIAGPGGGTKDKPVGLVYIGVAFKGKIKVERHIFSGNRRVIKERAAYTALDLLRRVLL